MEGHTQRNFKRRNFKMQFFESDKTHSNSLRVLRTDSFIFLLTGDFVSFTSTPKRVFACMKWSKFQPTLLRDAQRILTIRGPTDFNHSRD